MCYSHPRNITHMALYFDIINLDTLNTSISKSHSLRNVVHTKSISPLSALKWQDGEHFCRNRRWVCFPGEFDKSMTWMFDFCIVSFIKKKEWVLWTKCLWFPFANEQNQNSNPFKGIWPFRVECCTLLPSGAVSWRMIDSNCQTFAFEVKRRRKQPMQKVDSFGKSPTLQMKTNYKMPTKTLRDVKSDL